jgi:hypothetical protein
MPSNFFEVSERIRYHQVLRADDVCSKRACALLGQWNKDMMRGTHLFRFHFIVKTSGGYP